MARNRQVLPSFPARWARWPRSWNEPTSPAWRPSGTTIAGRSAVSSPSSPAVARNSRSRSSSGLRPLSGRARPGPLRGRSADRSAVGRPSRASANGSYDVRPSASRPAPHRTVAPSGGRPPGRLPGRPPGRPCPAVPRRAELRLPGERERGRLDRGLVARWLPPVPGVYRCAGRSWTGPVPGRHDRRGTETRGTPVGPGAGKLTALVWVRTTNRSVTSGPQGPVGDARSAT